MNVTRRQKLIVALVTAVAVLIMVAVTAVVISAVKSTSIRETQTENTALIENTSKTLEIMQGCTTPGEECFDRGQERTAELVAGLTSDLTRVSAYAAACADHVGVQTEDEIFACIVRRLAAADPGRP
jgi:hypothetical protein